MRNVVLTLVALLVVVFLGTVPNIADSIFPLDSPGSHTTLESNALREAARGVLLEADRFGEDISAIEGWRKAFERVERSDASARFPCMGGRTCDRDGWYIDAIRYVGTLAFESGSKEPIAKWVEAVRNATDDLSRCHRVGTCKDEAGTLLVIVRAHPDL